MLNRRSESLVSPTQRITKVEWVFVLIATLLGLGLRVWHLDRLAVEHFDEGVYASNLFFTANENYRYADQHLYAPPMVPSLIEWSMTFLGFEPWAPMIPGILLGAATVPLLWWMLRNLAGPVAAMLACWLLATNEYHIFYSRTALTEPVLGFYWVLALGLGARAFTVEATRTASIYAALAGLSCGLCWWTKYNGWLTTWIIISSAFLFWIFLDTTFQGLKKAAYLSGIVIASTLLTYAPYLWSLQKYGGYAAISRHHSQYMMGLENYFSIYQLQAQNYLQMTSMWTWWLGIFAIVVSLSLYWLRFGSSFEGTPPASERKSALASVIRLAAMQVTLLSNYATFLFVAPLLWCLNIFNLAVEVFKKRTAKPEIRVSQAFLQVTTINGQLPIAWCLFAWLTTLLLLTPIYFPYPRLLLPMVIAGIAAGAYVLASYSSFVEVNRILGFDPEARAPTIGSHFSWSHFIQKNLVYAVLVMFVVIEWNAFLYHYAPLAPDRTGLMQAVRKIAVAASPVATRQSTHVIVYVYAEPPVYWHLSQQQILSGPVSDLEFANPQVRQLGVPLYLVTGTHANLTPAFVEQMEAKKDLFEVVGTFQYQPSQLVMMDRIVGGANEESVETLTLWRVK